MSVSEPGKTYAVEVPSLEAQLVCPEGQARREGTCTPIPWDESKRGRTTAFWVTLGGAGALFATSAVTGIVALNADAYVKDNCSGPRDFCRVSDADEAATRAKTFAWISTLTLVGGGLATVVAFVLPREPVQNGPERASPWRSASARSASPGCERSRRRRRLRASARS